jgi:DNA-binding phage protein
MSTIPKQIQTLLEKSGKSYYQIAKGANINGSTIDRVKTEGWGQQLETAQKVLNAVGFQLKIEKL